MDDLIIQVVVRLALFTDLHLIGRKLTWEKKLEAAGLVVKDHRLCRL